MHSQVYFVLRLLPEGSGDFWAYISYLFPPLQKSFFIHILPFLCIACLSLCTLFSSLLLFIDFNFFLDASLVSPPPTLYILLYIPLCLANPRCIICGSTNKTARGCLQLKTATVQLPVCLCCGLWWNDVQACDSSATQCVNRNYPA